MKLNSDAVKQNDDTVTEIDDTVELDDDSSVSNSPLFIGLVVGMSAVILILMVSIAILCCFVGRYIPNYPIYTIQYNDMRNPKETL